MGSLRIPQRSVAERRGARLPRRRVSRTLEYLDSWGEPYHYDELTSERLSGPGDPDRTPPAKVRTQTFDLWSHAGRPAEESAEWITNYRNE